MNSDLHDRLNEAHIEIDRLNNEVDLLSSENADLRGALIATQKNIIAALREMKVLDSMIEAAAEEKERAS